MNKCKGCKYAGDLEEICSKYIFLRENGPVVLHNIFPLLCKTCQKRNKDFCNKFNDFICLNDQDPFNCNFTGDQIFGIELAKKIHKKLKNLVENCK